MRSTHKAQKNQDSESPVSSIGDMSTVIDRIVDYIREKKSATVKEVADSLALQHSQVEKLADILEESGLISVKYSLFQPSKTLLISKEPSSVAKKDVDAAIADLLASLDKGVVSSEHDFIELADDLVVRLRRVEETLPLIEKAEDSASSEELSSIVDELNKISTSFKELNGRIYIFEKKIDFLQRRIAALKAKTVKLTKPPSAIGSFIQRFSRLFHRGRS